MQSIVNDCDVRVCSAAYFTGTSRVRYEICQCHNCMSVINKLCGRPPQYAPDPCDLDLWPFDLESGVRVTCDVGYLCANFSLPRPLWSRLTCIPDVRDRQTDRRQTAASFNVPAYSGGGGIKSSSRDSGAGLLPSEPEFDFRSKTVPIYTWARPNISIRGSTWRCKALLPPPMSLGRGVTTARRPAMRRGRRVKGVLCRWFSSTRL